MLLVAMRLYEGQQFFFDCRLKIVDGRHRIFNLHGLLGNSAAKWNGDVAKGGYCGVDARVDLTVQRQVVCFHQLIEAMTVGFEFSEVHVFHTLDIVGEVDN